MQILVHILLEAQEAVLESANANSGAHLAPRNLPANVTTHDCCQVNL
jgi:hypothetical protein